MPYESTPGLSRRRVLLGIAAASLNIGATPIQRLPGNLGEIDDFVMGNALGGNVVVRLDIDVRGRGLTYFAPHDSEKTCVQAATAVIKKRGGTLAQLLHGGVRNITFTYNKVKYVFDPNRMFTDVGIKASLQLQGHTFSNDALGIVRGFGQTVLQLLELTHLEKGFVVGLHNNTPGAYSLNSYKPGGESAKDASQVHANPMDSPDDFFFVTTKKSFDYFAGKNYNVALQSPNVTDDGSLSVYCAQKGIPYVNSEAQNGHLAKQIAMIEAINDYVP